VEPRLVRWSVDDPTVASVDSLGILHPHRAGKVRVTANAGGWRTTWLQLSVRVPASAIEEIEEWNALSDTRWVAFGMPRPSIVDTPEGRRALHNAGDGTFLSGVYSTAEFAAHEGVGIDAELSTPVSLGQWQSQHVAFIIDADSTVLRSWDHVSGFFPNAAAPTAGVCGFSYPAGAEGVTYAETMNGGSGNVPGARWLGSGRWYRIRVQLLPDGRCAVAVNDRAVAITAPAARLDSRIRIALFGQSFNTQMLVGRLEVFRGVKTDVTWAELDSTLALRGSAWRAGARRVAAMPSPATAVYRANAR
ncbi:MAG TPA: hypothetical protein VFZ21_20260, partial [Gemmatimonadaceae bacterium]|nr:hypothetical protein [Gemmatimonadaceae bacterium]